MGVMLSAFSAKQDGGFHHASVRTAANAGSFDIWSQPLVLGRSPETGDFVRSLSLPPGTYQVGLCWPAEYTHARPESLTCHASACALHGQVGLHALHVDVRVCLL